MKINNSKFYQYYLAKKYEKAKPLYVVCRWYKYGVLECKWAGQFTKDGDPITIYHTDCNGLKDLYYLTPWFNETTGTTIAYFFNKQEADFLAKRMTDNETIYSNN